MPAPSMRVAQAQHGSAPDIAGQDRANPASLIGSAAMLLAWLGERRNDDRLTRAAATIEDALERAIASPQWRTPTSAARSERRRSASGWRRWWGRWRWRVSLTVCRCVSLLWRPAPPIPARFNRARSSRARIHDRGARQGLDIDPWRGWCDDHRRRRGFRDIDLRLRAARSRQRQRGNCSCHHSHVLLLFPSAEAPPMRGEPGNSGKRSHTSGDGWQFVHNGTYRKWPRYSYDRAGAIAS